MPSQQEQLRNRTKAFAVRVVRVYRSLPYRTDAQVLGKQLLRCGTAVAANYRAACRSRSRAEWVSKIGIVVEEADESVFWLEMLSDCEIVPHERLKELLAEAHELSACSRHHKQLRDHGIKLHNYPITKLRNSSWLM